MMPSRSCAADRRVKGFTLFELIIVLAIMGMLAGVVAVGVGRSSGIRHQRDAITNIASQLQLARVEAMKRGEQIEATITLNESGIGCGFAGREHEFPCAGLEIAAVDGQEPPEGWDVEGVRILFEADGRTRSRVIAFAGAGGSDTLLPHIEFDPISGAIELGRATEPSPRDQGGPDR